MHTVKIPHNLEDKDYFWYLHRSLTVLHKEGVINLELIENKFFDEPFFITIFVDDYPIFIDVRDNNTIDKDLDVYTKDYVLLKSNYSTELWDNPPENFEYPFKDVDRKMREKTKPFMHGRVHSRLKTNEFDGLQFDAPIKHTIASITGKGVSYNSTVNRLKVYDLLKEVYKDKANLVWIDKKHSVVHDEVLNYNQIISKFTPRISLPGYTNYIRFLKEAKFSLSITGISYSTPFRFIDAVMADRAIISTKIWHDLYKTFPCIELPICGHSGQGDWEAAKNILTNIETCDTMNLISRQKSWYSWFFSARGLFYNQILRWLK